MKNYWEWEPNYFENYILRNVKIPQEFTVQQFMIEFNKLPAQFRTVKRTPYNWVITLYPQYYGYCHRVVSGLLHNLLAKGVLKARYVSNGHKTETIFSKV